MHSAAYRRDTTFYSWPKFAITRALENQVYFVSLNRAGEEFGRSMFCPPWIDDEQHHFTFAEHDEQLTRLVVERSEIELARELYPFLRDRLEIIEPPEAPDKAPDEAPDEVPSATGSHLKLVAPTG
ncbi:MAG: hypothetical protein GY953_27440 [bacterium]|nr:hypothetical protein [bacterium]